MPNEQHFDICCKKQVNSVHDILSNKSLTLHCDVPISVVCLPEENCRDKLTANKAEKGLSVPSTVTDGSSEKKFAYLHIYLWDNDWKQIMSSNEIVQVVKLMGFHTAKYVNRPIIVVKIKEPPSKHKATYYILELRFVTEETTYIGRIQLHFKSRAKRPLDSTNVQIENSDLAPMLVVDRLYPQVESPDVPPETPPVQELKNLVEPIMTHLSENLKKLDTPTQTHVMTSMSNSFGEIHKTVDRIFSASRAQKPQ